MTTNAIKPLGPMPTEPRSMDMEYWTGCTPKDKLVVLSYFHRSDYLALRSYTEDCLARLRVAVGALDVLSSHTNLDANEMQDIAEEAYDAIGPLVDNEKL